MSDAAIPNPEPSPGPPAPARRRAGIRRAILLVALAVVGVAWGVAAVRDWARPAAGLVRGLRSGDPATRREAARGLTGLGPEEGPPAIPALVEAAGDPDEQANLAILVALGETGVLAAQDPRHREAARAATSALIRALADAREPVQAQAAHGLQTFAQLHPAGEGGPAFDPDAAAAALTPVALDERKPSARLAALQTLIYVAPSTKAAAPAALAAALAATASPGYVRGLAAALLGAFKVDRPAAIPRLIEALKDPDPRVRRGAAVGLAVAGRDDARPAIPALIPLLAEPVADPARGPGAGLVVTWNQSLYVEDPLAAPEVPGANRPAIDRWDPARMAAAALGVAGSREGGDGLAVPALAAMLTAEQPWRREAGASALNRIGRRAGAATPALLEALKAVTPEPPPALVFPSNYVDDLIQALAKVAPGGPLAGAAVEALTNALASPSPAIAYQAAVALADFGAAGAPALPALRSAARSPNDFLKTKAEAAIEAIEHPQPARRRGGGDGP